MLAYHISSGNYGETSLDGLNVIFVDGFRGQRLAGEATDAKMGFFFDEQGNEKTARSFTGDIHGKGWCLHGRIYEVLWRYPRNRVVPIKFELAKDLDYWSTEIPGKVVARAEALTGPITPQGKRVQTLDAPGSETGPGTISTWGRALANAVDARNLSLTGRKVQ